MQTFNLTHIRRLVWSCLLPFTLYLTGQTSASLNSSPANVAGLSASAQQPGTARWRPTGGPLGGNVYDLLSEGGKLFAATPRGLFVSTDSGRSWNRLNNGLPNGAVNLLAAQGSYLFAATADGIYRSGDDGQNWAAARTGLPIVAKLGNAPSNFASSGAALYANVGTNGIFVTADKGESWTPVNDGLPRTGVLALASRGNLLLAGTANGIYRSFDGGQNWQLANNGLPRGSSAKTFASSGEKIYAGVASPGNVYVSSDQGGNWTPLNQGLNVSAVYRLFAAGTDLYAGTEQGVFRLNQASGLWTAVNNGLRSKLVTALASQNAALFVAVSGDLYTSTNRGDEWTPLNVSFGLAGVRAYVLSGNDLYATIEDGVARLPLVGPGVWARSNQGLTVGEVRALAVHNANLLAGTFGGGVFVSTDRAHTWRALNNGLTDLKVQALATNNGWLYAGVEKRGVFRLDLNQSGNPAWLAINRGLEDKSVVSLAAKGAFLLAGTNKGVFRSADNGMTWTAVNNGLLLEQIQFNYEITSLLFNGNTLFAMQALQPTLIDGRIFGSLGGDSLFRSTDNGENWTRVAPPLNRSFNGAASMLAANGQLLFVNTNYGPITRDGVGQTSRSTLFVSPDQGLNWGYVPEVSVTYPVPAGDPTIAEEQITSVFLTDKLAFASTLLQGVFVRELETLSCSYSISPAGSEVKSEGEIIEVAVYDSNCPWTAESQIDWITITNGQSGLGDGAVKLAVAANPETVPRQGTVTVAGQIVPINQTQCGSLTAAQQSFEATGDTGGFGVQAHSSCGWTAVSQTDWVKVTAGTNGKGAGEVSYSVAANPSSSWRQATIRAAGYNFTVVQAGSNGGCNAMPLMPGEVIRGTLTAGDCPDDSALPNYSLADRYTFNAGAGQRLVIGLKPSFSGVSLTLLGPSNGFLASAYSGFSRFISLPESETLSVTNSGVHTVIVSGDAQNLGSYELSLSLLDPGCSSTITPPLIQPNANGGSGNVQINTATNCRWQTYSSDSWLKLSPATGTGPATVSYTVNPNLGVAREGRALIAGLDFSARQAAQNTPALTIANLNPSYASAGTPGLMLIVNGTGFVNGSKVLWKGQERPTTFVSSTQLTAAINAADLTSDGAASVVVSNPEPNSGQSAPRNFNLHPPNQRWVQTTGPGGGQITALLQHGRTLYAGTRQGKLYLSTDQGRNWEYLFGLSINRTGQLQPINDLAVLDKILFIATPTAVRGHYVDDLFRFFSPSPFPSNVSALLVKGNYVFAVADRLYRATLEDSQTGNWQPLTNGLPPFGNSPSSPVSLAELNGNLYVATPGDMLFVSADDGQTWREIKLATGNLFAIRKLLAANGTLYLGALDGVYRLTADEQLARIGQAATFSPDAPFNVNLLALSGTTLLAGSSLDGGISGLPTFSPGTTSLFRLGEDGNWTRSDAGLTAEHVTKLLSTATGVLAASFGAGILRSEDQGRTWRPSHRYLTDSTVTALASLGNSLFAATTHGIYRTVDNGLNWVPVNEGLKELSITALGTNGTALYAATTQGIFRSLDLGQSWKNTGLYGQSVRTFAFLGNQVFAAADGGTTLQALQIKTEPGNGIAAASPPADESGVFVLGSTGGWKAASRGLTNQQVSALAVSGNNLFASTLGGGIFVSTDGGQNWTARNAGFGNLNIFALANLGTTLYASTEFALYRSTDQGQTWQFSNTPDFGPSLAFAARGNTLFTSRPYSGLVYRSDDQGQTWMPIPETIYFPLALAVHGSFLVEGMLGGAALISDLAPGRVSTVSAASFTGNEIAADSIAVAFGSNLATTTQSATTVPLPSELGKTRVLLADSHGLDALFFVSPNQVNFHVSYLPPSESVAVPIIITSGDGHTSSGVFTLSRIAPGLFSANSDGKGVAAALALRVGVGGAQSYEPVARFDTAQNKFVPLPIDLGPENEQVYLVLFGTGIRHRLNLDAVRANIGGIGVPVEYAGAQGDLTGLDQINLRLPRALAGRGEVEVVITVEGKHGNAVRVQFR